MTLSEEKDAQGGLEQTATPDRVASLTGVRAVAALLVVGTHAAYTTGKYTHGYWGLVGARLEIGVPIFFVLSGFLLFRPWVKSAATDGPPPSLSRYARHRVRRIMPAYVITVLIAYVLYHFREAGPNPGHTWLGLVRNLTLTQIYTDGYLGKYLHQGLTQMWSLAVEAAFYVVLPLLAYLLLVLICRRRWQPKLTLAALAGDDVDQPGVADPGAHQSLDSRRRPAVAAHLPGLVPGRHDADRVAGDGRALLRVRGHTAGGHLLLHRLHPDRGRPHHVAGVAPGGPVEDRLLRRDRHAGGGPAGPDGDHGWYAQALASRPMVWLGEISYEIFLIHLVTMEFAMDFIVQAARLHRPDAEPVHRDAGGDDPVGLAAAPLHPGAGGGAARQPIGNS